MDKSGKLLVALAGLFLGLIVITAFALAFAGRDTTLLHDRIVHLSVNGTNVEIKLDQDNAVYNLPCLTTERDNEFTLLNDLSATVKINDTELKTQKTSKIKLDTLSDAARIKMEVQGGKDTRTVYFRTLPETLTALVIFGEGKPEDVFYITQKETATAFKINGEGHITWYRSEMNDTREISTISEFKGHRLANNEVYDSYHKQNPDINTYGYETVQPGFRHVFNQNGEKIKQTPFLSLLPGKEEDTEPIDSKGFLLLDKDSSIVSGYRLERVDNIPAESQPLAEGALLLSPVIQEVKNDTVVWEWSGSDDTKLYELGNQASHFKEQHKNPVLYAHIDTIIQDPLDGNLIVGFKDLGTVIKIDRETGKSLSNISFIVDEQKDEAETANLKDIQLLNVDDKGVATLLETQTGRLMIWDIKGFKTGDNHLIEIPKPEGFSEITTYRTVKKEGFDGVLVSGVRHGYGCVAYYEKGKIQPILEIRYPDQEKPASAYGVDVSYTPKEKDNASK